MVCRADLLHGYFCGDELATFVLKNWFRTCLIWACGCSRGLWTNTYRGYFWLLLFKIWIIFFNHRIM